MDRHVIDLPRKVVVGRGVIGEVGGYASQLYPRGASILVVTGPRVHSLYYPRVRQSLEEAGFSVDSIVVSDATVETAERVAGEAGQRGVKVLVGLGGGRSIDIAKYASSRAGAGFISLPTVASHDGITSPFASLKGFDRPISRRARPPDIIILDVDVISKAPKRYNIAGFGDLIGKFTAVRDWRLAHKLRGEYYGEYAASLALMSARHVASYAREIGVEDEEVIQALVMAAKIRPERYTILGEKGLTREAAEKVARATGVIQ